MTKPTAATEPLSPSPEIRHDLHDYHHVRCQSYRPGGPCTCWEWKEKLIAELAKREDDARRKAWNEAIVEATIAARDWNPDKHEEACDAVLALAKECTESTHIWRSGECRVCDVSKALRFTKGAQ